MAATVSDIYAQHLRRQHAAVQAFVEILHSERDVLALRPMAMDRLGDVTEAKTAQALALEDMERARRTMADAERADAPGLDDGEIAERLGCRALWVQLIASVAAARTQNDINGVAIHTRLDYANRALGFLRRRADRSLYAADGQRQARASGRLRGGA